METVLNKIIESKKKWVFAKKRTFPLDIFKNDIVKSDRDFNESLTSSQAVFILECKKGSPSKGLIRKKFNLNEITSVYKNYANVISVLTDEEFFMGSFANLSIVRKNVSQPILCKDFIIDEYQVYLARHYGADAILLMLSVLSDAEYVKLTKVAYKLGMGVLTEASNEKEVQRAINLKAKVVGINNRNLRDLSVDLNTTRLLAPKLPKGVIVISESGIGSNKDIRDLRKYADGFLIGSSIMSERNIELAVRKMVYGFNKVCGLTSVENAQKAYNSGAVFGGFIFVPESPRYIDMAKAKTIRNKVRFNYVGVFKNHDIKDIVDHAYALKLAAVQLHGNENQEYIDTLKSKLHKNCQIWNAYGVKTRIPVFMKNVDYHLLDTKIGVQTGGTGKKFDWTLIEDTKKIILAGGIGPSNISEAIKIGCSALDLNSGVEYKTGEKSYKKLQEVFNEIRNY